MKLKQVTIQNYKSCKETVIDINDEILSIKDTIVASVDPEKVYLFGSYAYGTPHKDSDYDFYVVLKDDSPIKPLDAMQQIRRNLMNMDTWMPIDLLANYKNRFDYRSNEPTIERTISKNGVILYERH
jgi:predicted nucleotidyltransferase